MDHVTCCKMANQNGDAENIIEEDFPVKIVDGQLSYIGRDCRELPVEVVNQARLARRVDLSFNLLVNLDGLENCENLEELIVDNNELTDDLVLPSLPMLHTLMVNKNRLKDLEHLLGQLKDRVPNLRYLSLLGNEACPNELSNMEKDEEDYARYRLYVLHRLPQLKFLDSSPVKETERQEAVRQGPYLRVVKPCTDETSEQDNMQNKPDEMTSPYTPLPGTLRDESESDPKAMFGKCRYVYYGRHSEGNRFIRNNDL